MAKRKEDVPLECAISSKGEIDNFDNCIEFDALDKFSEHQVEAVSSPGYLIQVRKQRVPPIVVSCSEFGGFRQEILNSVKEIKVSFQIAKKETAAFYRKFL